MDAILIFQKSPLVRRLGPERAGNVLVNEGHCSGTKTKGQIQQRLRRRDQQEWVTNRWRAYCLGGYYSMVLRFQASDLVQGGIHYSPNGIAE